MRLLLLSDIQGNTTALDTVIASPEARAADRIVSLGDVASGPGAREVVTRLRAMDVTCVRGNMDEVIADPPPVAGSDAEARRFAEIDRWCASQLSPEDRAWLADRPLTALLDLPGGRQLLACHGSPTSIDAVLDAETPAGTIHELLGDTTADVVAVGHLHDSMQRSLGDMLVINPGSVGWPDRGLNGKRPLEASFAVLDAAAEGVRVSFFRLHYAPEAFQEAVTSSRMPHADWYLAQWDL